MSNQSDIQIDPVIQRVYDERNQGLATRAKLYTALENLLGKPVISFFTSFNYPVSLEDSDVDILAGMLQMMDLSSGIVLLISSPGGDGLSAERMINICRSLSGTGNYEIIVPGKAKSAATMVCFGASKIYMGPTSELGPVDPQVIIKSGDSYNYISAHYIVESYKELFNGAIKETGNLEPYLQQLANYDAAKIKHYEELISLSKKISINVLSSGMMSSKTSKEIEKSIGIFLDPKNTSIHGRPIFANNAQTCGLNIELLNNGSEQWNKIYELYIRLNNFVSTSVSKCIEYKEHSFVASVNKESR